jgi:hypothetical protein
MSIIDPDLLTNPLRDRYFANCSGEPTPNAMSQDVAFILREIAISFLATRNRFGRIDERTGDLAQIARQLKLPHGGVDVVDQASMILQRLVGDEPISVLDTNWRIVAEGRRGKT